MSLFDLVRKDLGAAEIAQRSYNDALVDYQAACMVADWPKAEASRVLAISHMEAFLDNIGAAYKELRRHD